MITEDYVKFEIAKLLKEKGFNEKTYRCYNLCTEEHELSDIDDIAFNNWELDNDGVAAPTLQMTIKWLREVHKLYVVVRPYVTEDGIFSLFDVKSIKGKDIVANIKTRTGFNSYEQACEAAIKYCLENLI